MMRFGLAGYPLGHSLSPLIFRTAFEECELHGDYSLIQIHPENPRGLAEMLEKMREGQFDGLNITIPFKQRVMPLLDEITASARMIGAVNLIYVKEGELVGDNTDAAGFMADLSRWMTIDSVEQSKNALVLGAGGAARAVVFALAARGWKVTIAARNIDQANAIITQFQPAFSQIDALNLTKQEIGAGSVDWKLIVNSTPVGMHPVCDASPWPSGLQFPPGSTIYDLVYNPRETRFIREARRSHLTAISGIGMLVEQAALAFEKWTNRKFSRNGIFAALEGK